MKIDYKQLAFILDIKPVEALEKIIYVDCKIKGTITPRSCDTVKEYLFDKQKSKSVRNSTPESLDVALLEEHLNLPTLSQAIQDIQNNYLIRPASKKWILCDYPEKQLMLCHKGDKPSRIPFPKALESLLPVVIVDTIKKEWAKRFPNARIA